MNVPELLAPAGSLAALNAAVRSGADAVYLGLDNFNARRGADNFTLETLSDACDYCHLRGVKVYVTINTFVITRELSSLMSMINGAIDCGVDAFIIQDPGICNAISSHFGPGYVHISTQMNIHNVDGVYAAKALGAGRITLARELSLGEIEEIVKVAHDLSIEIECFAHGAICVCYSGQCLMSSCIGARSANRGMCAQACRLPYSLLRGDEKKLSSKETDVHLLSPKDMCLIDDLTSIANAGVDSIKIEGRMKSPEYVSSVVEVYRAVLDRIKKSGEANSTTAEMNELKASFSRGFTDGYLHGERGNDFMSYARPNNRGLFVGRIKSKRILGERRVQLEIESDVSLFAGDTITVWTKHGTTAIVIPNSISTKGKRFKFETDINCKDVREKDRVFRVRSAEDEFHENFSEPRLPISASLVLEIGQPSRLTVISGEKSVYIEGSIVEPARTKVVSREDVEAHFNRLGNTDFYLDEFELILDAGVGIGFSEIHRLRASAIDKLRQLLCERENVCAEISSSKIKSRKKSAEPVVCAIVANAEDARLVNRAGVVPYVQSFHIKHGQGSREGAVLAEPTQSSYPNDVTVMAPLVSRDSFGDSRERKLSYDTCETVTKATRVYCDDIAHVLKAKANEQQFEIGQFFPVTNDCTVDLVNKMCPEVVWISPELNMAQIADVASKIDSEVGVFVCGPQRLMTTEHCILMSEGPCNEDCPGCRRRRQKHFLHDRKEVDFPVVSDCFGRSTIYNSVDLDLTPNLIELMNVGVSRFMIDATLMPQKELTRTISRVKEALKNSPKSRQKNTTSGHLFRGV